MFLVLLRRLKWPFCFVVAFLFSVWFSIKCFLSWTTSVIFFCSLSLSLTIRSVLCFTRDLGFRYEQKKQTACCSAGDGGTGCCSARTLSYLRSTNAREKKKIQKLLPTQSHGSRLIGRNSPGRRPIGGRGRGEEEFWNVGKRR